MRATSKILTIAVISSVSLWGCGGSETPDDANRQVSAPIGNSGPSAPGFKPGGGVPNNGVVGVAGSQAMPPSTVTPMPVAPAGANPPAPAPTPTPTPLPGGMAPPRPGPAPAPAPAPAAPPPAPLGPGQTLPPVTDYTKAGPFATMTVNNTGPDGMYTMVRPTQLGQDGFKHPVLTWGNGITTTPATYPILLATVASHGFVIIASNSTSVSAQMMTAGLDWLIAQNTASGPLMGKLDTERAVAMGYSLGGGASLSVSGHKNVIATIAMHPAPGFGTGTHGPVLLFSGTNDVVCAPALVQSAYSGLKVPAFYALLEGADHLEPVLSGGRELGASIAWLRLWVYNDQGGKSYFYGDSCTLCKAPWTKMTNAAWK